MSEIGNLSQCMVDGDAAAKTRARKLRRKALAASVALEAAAVAGVMPWPLATLGVLPVQVVVTPLPPFKGAPEPQQNRAQITMSLLAVWRKTNHLLELFPCNIEIIAGERSSAGPVSGVGLLQARRGLLRMAHIREGQEDGENANTKQLRFERVL